MPHHSRSIVQRVLARTVDAALEVSVVGSFTAIGSSVRARTDTWERPSPGRLAGRTAVVTGATSGLGESMAIELARLGAHVHVVGRSSAKVSATVGRLNAIGSAEGHVADLERLDDVRRVGGALARGGPIHALAHVAGMLVHHQAQTADGIDQTAQVHVVAPFLLTTLLFDRLRADGDARVITMSSGGMYTRPLDVERLLHPPSPFNGTIAYAGAKRAQVELNREWARRYPASGVGFHAVHPGWADTPGLRESLPGFRRVIGPLLRDAAAGSDTAAWLAWAGEATAPGGGWWHDRRRRRTSWRPGTTATPADRARLWAEVRRAAGLGELDEPSV